MKLDLRRYLPLLGLLAILFGAWLAYAPGLSGDFQFDDFVNLDALGSTGAVEDWPTFWRYVTSGVADPTGRPLALLSFLFDARDWPADPAPFLITNLSVHLLNGALLFALLRQLGRALGEDETRNDLAALLGTGLWLMHPLLVSTTLYVVQREAMLPATFTLIGLWIYGDGRRRFEAGASARGLVQIWLGITFGTVLAMLCKGNGILLPLLAGVLEFTIWRNARITAVTAGDRQRLRRTIAIVLVAPSLLVLFYLCLNLPHLYDDLPSRRWTIAQRLLTEPRVLLDYLQLLAVPRSVSTGLYNDGYPVSTGLLSPLTTLPALALVILLIYAAFRYRARTPRLSASILFFFAGQSLESSTIPLEIYFEHRNYLPALLIFWPLANSIVSWHVRPFMRAFVALLLLTLCFSTTRARADLWGRPAALAQLWALQNPDSSRAQATAAMALMSVGQYELAASRLGAQLHRQPYDLQLALNYIDAACNWRGVDNKQKLALDAALRHADEGALLIHNWLGRAIDVAQSRQCTGLDLLDVEAWVEASASNPQISRAGMLDQTIEPLRARLAIARQQPDVALTHFNKALLSFNTPDAAARFVALLASAGYYEHALLHLEFYDQHKSSVRKPGPGMPRVHAKVLDLQNYWPREMAILKSKLRSEIADQSGPTPASETKTP